MRRRAQVEGEEVGAVEVRARMPPFYANERTEEYDDCNLLNNRRKRRIEIISQMRASAREGEVKRKCAAAAKKVHAWLLEPTKHYLAQAVDLGGVSGAAVDGDGGGGGRVHRDHLRPPPPHGAQAG